MDVFTTTITRVKSLFIVCTLLPWSLLLLVAKTFYPRSCSGKYGLTIQKPIVVVNHRNITTLLRQLDQNPLLLFAGDHPSE